MNKELPHKPDNNPPMPRYSDTGECLYGGGFDLIRKHFVRPAKVIFDLAQQNHGCIVTAPYGNGTSEHLIPAMVNLAIRRSLPFLVVRFQYPRSHEEIAQMVETHAQYLRQQARGVLILDHAGEDFFDLDNPRTGYWPTLVASWSRQWHMIPIIAYKRGTGIHSNGINEETKNEFLIQWQNAITQTYGENRLPVVDIPPYRFDDNVAREIVTGYLLQKKMVVDPQIIELFIKVVPHQLRLFVSWLSWISEDMSLGHMIVYLKQGLTPKYFYPSGSGILIGGEELELAYQAICAVEQQRNHGAERGT